MKEVMFSLASTIQRLGKVREAIKQYKKILGLPKAFFKKVAAGEIGNPDSYLTKVRDVTAVDKSTILFKIAQHYVNEAEDVKAKVAADCAFKVIEEEGGRGVAELRRDIKELLDNL